LAGADIFEIKLWILPEQFKRVKRI
jgi:hypothetical protein